MLTDDEQKYIRRRDYLWLLVPIAGPALFVAVVLDRKRRAEKSN